MHLRSTTEYENGGYQLSPFPRGTPRLLRQGVALDDGSPGVRRTDLYTKTNLRQGVGSSRRLQPRWPLESPNRQRWS
jgi:hypothetical protein